MLMSTAVALLAAALVVGPAPEQTAATSSGAPAARQGAFAALSPGNQKIARALYEAQAAQRRPNLTLDQIATLKQEGQGWGNVFRQMKAQGRVDARNLGAVVSASSHPAPPPAATAAATVGGKTARTTTSGPAPKLGATTVGAARNGKAVVPSHAGKGK